MQPGELMTLKDPGNSPSQSREGVIVSYFSRQKKFQNCGKPLLARDKMHKLLTKHLASALAHILCLSSSDGFRSIKQ